MDWIRVVRLTRSRCVFGWLLAQAGDVAFEVPMSLVVTLERVLGDESVGEIASCSRTEYTYLQYVRVEF
jgi:hypothetical protein